MEIPQNGWFIGEVPIKINDLRVPQFQETSMPVWPTEMHMDMSQEPFYTEISETMPNARDT